MIHSLVCPEHGAVEWWVDQASHATFATCPRSIANDQRVPAWGRCSLPLTHKIQQQKVGT